MKNLSNEVKLDIFKYLNFNQLNVIQQTNKSFCGIVDRYKTELARKEVFALEIDWKYYVCKQVKCPSKSLHFQLNPDTKAKWNDALKQQIPIFISQPEEIHQHRFDEAVNLFLFLEQIYESPGSSDGRASVSEDNNNNKLPPKILHLQLKRYPKNIEELFFVRYWLETLSQCHFGIIKMKQTVLNPKMIDLLFEDSPPLVFYTNFFCLNDGYTNTTFELIYHHVKISEPKGFYIEDKDKTVRGEIIKEEQNFVKQKHICENIEEEGECNEEDCEECKKNNEEVKELCKFVEYKFENVWVKNKIFRLLLIFSADSKEVLEMYQKG